jgi:DNA-binding NarL/FixJ family response regulator
MLCKGAKNQGVEMPDGPAVPATSVALVEDDRATRERLASSVRAQSSLELVAEYRNGAEALAGLASRAPDVLLVDLGLPDMSGLELIRFAAERYPQCDILVISIFGDEANVLAALEAGARGYLLKGSLQHDIAFDIRDIRNGGSPLSPVVARQMLKRLRIPMRVALGKKADEETMLTPREGEILNAISRGFSYAETAQMLGVSVGTVHSFLKRVYRKLAVHSKTEAVFEANRLGLIR